ncbi:YihY/virulence factor BrkB family protein [Desulfopila sp. IMCC35006]|nr:YihY/virulence factor BrkB family protein [Desulfopila sp. IMCC35006]
MRPFGAIKTQEDRDRIILGWSLNLGGTTAVALSLLRIVGEVLILTSIYLVMPVVRVRFRHALIGGVTATVLWEITRRVLIWYCANVSMVNIIYVSIAITVVALISIEIVPVILLLGAQGIVELERKSDTLTGRKNLGIKT